jgi:transposase
LITLKTARPSTIRSFFYKHNVRRAEAVEKRLQRIEEAIALTTDDVVVSVAKMELKLLVELAKTFNKHIAGFQKEIAAAFQSHPDAELFRDLPGAGPALAPRLLAAFGSDRTRYESAANLQKFAGVAPVREKSGGQLWTHWRWQAPAFLRQTFVEWTGQTVVWSEWARRYYERKKLAGKKHHSILRSLAFKWIRILWKCWKDRKPYDEARYLETLKKRNSPNYPVLLAA